MNTKHVSFHYHHRSCFNYKGGKADVEAILSCLVPSSSSCAQIHNQYKTMMIFKLEMTPVLKLEVCISSIKKKIIT